MLFNVQPGMHPEALPQSWACTGAAFFHDMSQENAMHTYYAVCFYGHMSLENNPGSFLADEVRAGTVRPLLAHAGDCRASFYSIREHQLSWMG